MTLFKTCDKLQGIYYYSCFKDFPRGSEGKEYTCIAGCKAGDPSSTPGLGRYPAKGMATLSSILAWRLPWTEEPGGLESMGSKRVGHN